MLRGRELAKFRKLLLDWFGHSQRDLPWRRTKNPYRIWLSEIMLQQTRVAAVIPYYARFLERFPTVKSLAEAPQVDVLRLWSGLGYYSRARNLQYAAQQVAAKHGGQFPACEEDALSLPGIGSYTAAAILSIAFGKKFAVLDGNVARVIARLGAVRGELREPKRWKGLQETASKLLDHKNPGDWNQAMMELGATICTPRAPQCPLCPVAEFCQARKLGLAEILPEKRRKRQPVKVTLAAAVFSDSRGRTLLLPSPKSQPNSRSRQDIAALVSRMWHFPTVQIRRNAAEELRGFLAGFLKSGENFSQQLEPLRKARHTVTYRDITLFPFRVPVAKLPRISGAKMISLAELSSLPVSNLTRKVARAALQVSAARSAIR
jgi:A/G-specific adenine glycosylase